MNTRQVKHLDSQNDAPVLDRGKGGQVMMEDTMGEGGEAAEGRGSTEHDWFSIQPVEADWFCPFLTTATNNQSLKILVDDQNILIKRILDRWRYNWCYPW